MKTIRLALPLILLFPTSAFAGNIFGDLKDGGRSVGKGVEIRLTCGDGNLATMTDDYGAYSINAPNGRCELSVKYPSDWTPPFPVVSSDDPARYDFDLVNQDGRYVLRRR